jgi:hypothetical protein
MPDFEPKLSGATATLECNDFSVLPDSSASDATNSSNMEMFSSIAHLQDEDDSATTKRVLTKMETESDESINPEAPMADNEIGQAMSGAVLQDRLTQGVGVFGETETTEVNTLSTTLAIETIQGSPTESAAAIREIPSVDTMISEPAVTTDNSQGQLEEPGLLDGIKSRETREMRSDVTTSQQIIAKPGTGSSPRELSKTRNDNAEHGTAQVASGSKVASKSESRLHNENAVSKRSAKPKNSQSYSIITNFTEGEVIVIDDDDEQDRMKLEIAESASTTLKDEECMEIDNDDTEADDTNDASNDEESDEATTDHRISPRQLHDGLLPWGDTEFEAQNGSKVEHLFESLQWHWIRFHSLKSMHGLLCVQAFNRQVISIIKKTSNNGHLSEADLDKLHKGCTKFVANVSRKLRETHEKRKVKRISKLVRRLCDEGNVRSLIESCGMTDGDKSDKNYNPARKQRGRK